MQIYTNLYEFFTEGIQFEINKHGQCGGYMDVESVVNSMSQYEFLERLSLAFDKFNK